MSSRTFTASQRPWRVRSSGEWRERLGWTALVTGLCAAVGVAAGAAPIVMFGAAAFVAGTAAFMAWPWAVLLGILLLRPSLDTSGSLISFGGVNLAGVIALGAASAGGLVLLVKAPRMPGRRGAIPFLLLLVLAFLSIGYTPDPGEAFRVWVRLAAVVVIFLLAAWLVREGRDLRRLVAVIVISASLPVAVGLFQFATGSGLILRTGAVAGVPGTFLHPNGLAFFLLVALTLGLVVLLETSDRRLRSALLAGLALAGACLFLTYTRSAWVALVVIGVMLATMHYRQLFAAAGILAVLAALAVPSGLGAVENRFDDLSGSSGAYSGNSLQWRQRNWSRMLPYAFERPLTGSGLGSYLSVSRGEFHPSEGEFESGVRATEDKGPESRRGVYAHNDFVELAVELGFVAALLYITTLVVLAVAMYRATRVAAIRPYAVAAFALVIALIGVSAFDHVKANGAVSYAIAAVCGAIVGVSHRSAAKPSARRPGSIG